MAGRSAPQPTLEEQIAALQAQVAALLDAGAETASTAAREARATGAAAAAATHARIEDATAGIAEEVRARPFTSLALALAVGSVIGRVVAR
jgi:ElaB/YqjD/DUF883 family membrane-anchored ribosome-binding protein